MTALDEVAWLTNLRGSDVDYNPIFTSYFLLTADAATLYVAGSKATFQNSGPTGISVCAASWPTCSSRHASAPCVE